MQQRLIKKDVRFFLILFSLHAGIWEEIYSEAIQPK